MCYVGGYSLKVEQLVYLLDIYIVDCILTMSPKSYFQLFYKFVWPDVIVCFIWPLPVQ